MQQKLDNIINQLYVNKGFLNKKELKWIIT